MKLLIASLGLCLLYFLIGLSLYMLYCCLLVILRRFGLTRHLSYLDTTTNELFIKAFGSCPRNDYGEYGNSVGSRLLGIVIFLFILGVTMMVYLVMHK